MTSKYDNGRLASPIKDRIRLNTIIDNNGCWIWQTKYVNKWGYARMIVGSRRNNTRRSVYVYRASYIAYKGDVEKGLQIDHLCRNKLCCNPEHLEAVTPAVNNSRNPNWSGNKKCCGLCGKVLQPRKNSGSICPDYYIHRRRTVSKKLGL